MTFWQALKQTYSGSTAFMLACPLLALIPVVFEMAQHVVEVRIGLYASLAAAKAHEHDSWRMGFGLAKVTALFVSAYWVTRFLAWRDPARAWRPEPRAVRLFAGVLAVQLVLAVIQLFVLPPLGWVLLLSFLVGQVVTILLLAWGVAAPLGNAAIGPRRSAAMMARHIPWTFAFMLVASLPLMIPHQLFAILAIKGPAWALWPVLFVDSLLVGWLGPVLLASGYIAATRAAGKVGVALDPLSNVPHASAI